VRHHFPEEAMSSDTAYRPYRLLLVVPLLLLVPLVAMQFSREVVWGALDFAAAFVLLFGAGLGYQLISRRRADMRYRFAVGLGVLAALMLVWVSLAVGLIGNEDDPRNLMYAAPLLIGAVAVAISRLEPRGMANAMFATASAIALVAAIALIAGGWREEPREVVKILAVNGFFTALFAASGALFRS